MCVIAFSPKNTKLPTEKEIREMFHKNPDGAGYAWDDGKQIHFRKGFMSIEDFLKDLGDLDKWTDKAIAMHFRIGTAGENDAKTTHPFPITTNFGEMRKLIGVGPVLFHNGVMHDLGGIIDPLSSDTQDFVAGIASKLLSKPRKSKVTDAIVEKVIDSSRLLLMYGRNQFTFYGKWEEYKGNKYSNLLWKPSPKYTQYDYSEYYGYQTVKYPENFYGCNTDTFAWPSAYNQWIKVTQERSKWVKSVMKKIEGKSTYKMKSCPELEWKTNYDYTEWWTTGDGEKRREFYMKDTFADDFENCWDTEYFYYEDEDELMDEILIDMVQLTDNTFEDKEGRIFAIDRSTQEVMTELIASQLSSCRDSKKAFDALCKYGHLPMNDKELNKMEGVYNENHTK